MANKKEAYFFKAQTMYCEGSTLKDINEILPVSPHTLSKWKSDGEWEIKRKKYLTSAMGSSEVLANEVDKLITKIKEDGLYHGAAGELNTLVNLVEKLRNNFDMVNSAMIIMREWAKFLKKVHPECAEDQISIISEFIEYIDKEN